MITSERDLIGLETDLEPDDVYAVYLLNKIVKFNHVVSGEGDGDIKKARMREYLKLLNSKAQVFRGLSSSKLFDKDGKEFDDLFVEKTQYDRLAYVQMIKKYVENSSNPVLVFLKPPRELFENLSELKETLSTVTGYFYGGFNFRCLMDWNDLTKNQKIIEMLSSFKEVNIYESYHATGDNNTINRLSDPQLHEILCGLCEHDKYIDKLFTLTKLWNTNLLDDCYKTCQKLTTENIDDILTQLEGSSNPKQYLVEHFKDQSIDTNKFYRNWKAYSNIKGNEDFQFVMADMCAVIAFFSDKLIKYRQKANLSISSDGYTQYSPTNVGQLFYYKGIPRDELISEMISYLK